MQSWCLVCIKNNKRLYIPTKFNAAEINWTCYNNAKCERLAKKFSIENYKKESALNVPKETIQRRSKSLTERLQHINRVLETGCTGSIKVALSHQQRSILSSLS